MQFFSSAPPGQYRFSIVADVGIVNVYLWGIEFVAPPPAVPVTGA